jgi:cytochrome oxidase Cu insertion factor (SCO1/SenC/PrrC family)
MTSSATKFWLLLVCLLATMYGSLVIWRREHASPPAPAQPAEIRAAAGPPLEEFVLTDSAGQKFDSQDLRGKVWVASFFFTNCPGTCWRLNQTLAGLQQISPSSDVRYVSITCDPDNDTPEALATYAKHFKADPARWTFLTGDFALIKRIANEKFHVAIDRGERATHSDRAFVVDRKGEIRGRFSLLDPQQVEMLKALLAVVESEPSAAPAAAQLQSPPKPAAGAADAATAESAATGPDRGSASDAAQGSASGAP